jgi:hypothetical protein
LIVARAKTLLEGFFGNICELGKILGVENIQVYLGYEMLPGRGLQG